MDFLAVVFPRRAFSSKFTHVQMIRVDWNFALENMVKSRRIRLHNLGTVSALLQLTEPPGRPYFTIQTLHTLEAFRLLKRSDVECLFAKHPREVISQYFKYFGIALQRSQVVITSGETKYCGKSSRNLSCICPVTTAMWCAEEQDCECRVVDVSQISVSLFCKTCYT